MGKRNEKTLPSTNTLPGLGIPALTLQELEVRAGGLRFHPLEPGAPPLALWRENQFRGWKRRNGNIVQSQTAHARGLTIQLQAGPMLPETPTF